MNKIKHIVAGVSVCIILSCGREKADTSQKISKEHGEFITDSSLQKEIFSRLAKLTQQPESETNLNDSMAFLLLPVKASCPACRRKTIDSIDKYKNRLNDSRYIVIVGNGIKSINGFFKQQNRELPVMAHNIFIDTSNYAILNDLTSSNPNIYYAFRGKAYLKISCQPNTIRNDLKKYFKDL